ncbi:MAG: VanZ family protein [Candidatus Hydrogenedentes bacterium]|nr:VanZ family protein [Candidatus Hydrogenedentota bacterium]
MRWPYIIATAAYCGLIWQMSSDTTPPTWKFPWQIEGLDKVFHAVVYAVLGAIVSVGMRRSGKPVSPWAQCFVPVLFATFYGLSDEVHQLYVPSRNFDIGDLLADMAGATMAQVVLCYLYWRGGHALANP